MLSTGSSASLPNHGVGLEVRELQAKRLRDLLVLQRVASTNQHQALQIWGQSARLKDAIATRLAVIHQACLNPNGLQISLNSAVPIDVLPHRFSSMTSHILEVCKELALLEKHFLLQGTSEFIQNVLHAILFVDLLQVKVLGFGFSFTLQGGIQGECHLRLSHIVLSLKHPSLHLALILGKGSKVGLLISPFWRCWSSATAPTYTWSRDHVVCSRKLHFHACTSSRPAIGA